MKTVKELTSAIHYVKRTLFKNDSACECDYGYLYFDSQKMYTFNNGEYRTRSAKSLCADQLIKNEDGKILGFVKETFKPSVYYKYYLIHENWITD